MIKGTPKVNWTLPFELINYPTNKVRYVGQFTGQYGKTKHIIASSYDDQVEQVEIVDDFGYNEWDTQWVRNKPKQFDFQLCVYMDGAGNTFHKLHRHTEKITYTAEEARIIDNIHMKLVYDKKLTLEYKGPFG